jgi:hypothetical protein
LGLLFVREDYAMRPDAWIEIAQNQRWARGDGAAVECTCFGAKRPWVAIKPGGGLLSGRLYADWSVGTGAVRTFGTAKTAMQALDRDMPAKGPHPTQEGVEDGEGKAK